MKTATSFVIHILRAQFVVVRETPRILYGDGFAEFPDEKDLLRAHVVVELMERYRYPLEAIMVRSYLPIQTNAGMEYAEADLIIYDSAHRPFVLMSVEPSDTYELNAEENLRKLFSMALSLHTSYPPRYLAYYTRWYEGEARKTLKFVIDYSAYKTFEQWDAAFRPTVKDIPANLNNSEEIG